MNKCELKQRVFSLLDDAFDSCEEAREIVNKLDFMGFFDAPASTKYHGSYPGGLAEHSLNVTAALLELTKDMCLRWTRPQSPVIIGLFHDLCKCDQYKRINQESEFDPAYEYDRNTVLKGHGDKSVMVASTILRLTPEEVLCIRYHMGAFCEKEEWNDYTHAVHNFPNVLFTHTADMMAAHITEVA